MPPLMAQAPTAMRTRQCEADIDHAVELLLVVQRRFVEIDKFDQFDDPLVDVEQ